MNHLALFNGIGGFQLAASWMGWNNVASVEIDDFCNRVTAFHFPNCKQFKDIKDFTAKNLFDEEKNQSEPFGKSIDIISGGFP